MKQMPPLPPLKKKKESKNITPCSSQVQPTIFVLIPVSFRLISAYSGVFPARSGTILAVIGR